MNDEGGDMPFVLRRVLEDNGDEEDRPRKAPRRMNDDLQMFVRAERARQLKERIQRIRVLYVHLRLVVGLDPFVARDTILFAFDPDDVALALQNMPQSLAVPGSST